MTDDTPSTSPVQDAYAAIMNAITRGATHYEPQMHDSSVVRDLAEAYALLTRIQAADSDSRPTM